MMKIKNYLHASSLEQAYNALQKERSSAVLGGCGYLRMGSRSISTAIDLSKLELDTICETEDTLEIGAMTTFRDLETDAAAKELFNGVLSESVKSIVGVQFRQVVTAGGTVAGRFPFSDLITALMALDTQLSFYNKGSLSLEAYLEGSALRDVLEKIVIAKDGRKATFASMRNSHSDYAILNVAVSQKENDYRIIVGARPGRATHVEVAAEYLSANGLTLETAGEAARLAANEMDFGSNLRGSAEYRKALCVPLVKRALREVMHAG